MFMMHTTFKDLDGVNTEVCEQLFRKVNSHSNCKSMNEGNYFLFWLYNLDLHNLDIEDLVSASDPRSDYRWQRVVIMEADLSNIKIYVDKPKFDVVIENLELQLSN